MKSLGSVPNSVSKPVKIPLESLQLHCAVPWWVKYKCLCKNVFLRIVYVWLFALKLKSNILVVFIDMSCWSVRHEWKSQ